MHPDGKAHGGSAILIRKDIKHYEANSYCKEHIRATSIIVEDWIGQINFVAIYCPPKHMLKKEQYIEFFKAFQTFYSGRGLQCETRVLGIQNYSA